MTSGFKTPLHAWHVSQGAKMAPFAGWDMPIQYTSILAEHQHTREKAGLFDICHMGEFFLKGPGAGQALARAVSHNLKTLAPGRCRYGFLLNENGGVLDDLIVYNLEQDHYLLVVNAGCRDSDFQTIQSRLPADNPNLKFIDASEETAKIDLQGPLSLEVLRTALPDAKELNTLKYFSFFHTQYLGRTLMVSRTGYTGEFGYELYIAANEALPLWEALLADERVLPVGLGARDTLRLEVGLPLYGQDLDTEHTPAEAGYSMLLTSPADYVGKGADTRVERSLLGLALEGRRSARHGDTVHLESGQEVGVVTSGSFAPSLGHAVALAYVDAAHAQEDGYVIKTARTELSATRVELPFYTQGTARKKL